MYCQPRFGEHCHLLRRFEDGALVEERKIRSSQRMFAYYWLWFWHHNVELWKFSRRRSDTLVVCGHPVGLFGKSFVGLFRRLRYSYLIGDYFPDPRFVIRAYERLKRFYHDHVDSSYYLSDAINRKMNDGIVRADSNHRTVMWGLRPFEDCQVSRAQSRRLLFVGLMRPGQGIEEALKFVSSTPDLSLALVGVAVSGFEKRIKELIRDFGVGDRVYFENRFHSEAEVKEIAKSCFCGLALYDLDRGNFTHYADPGKVKAYMEFILPVVMTRISDIVPYVERYHAGEIIDSNADLDIAVSRIAAHYDAYARGVAAFNRHFDYYDYYSKSYEAWCL